MPRSECYALFIRAEFFHFIQGINIIIIVIIRMMLFKIIQVVQTFLTDAILKN